MHFVFNAFKTNEHSFTVTSVDKIKPIIKLNFVLHGNKASPCSRFLPRCPEAPWSSARVRGSHCRLDRLRKTRKLIIYAINKPLHMFDLAITNKLISGTYFGWGRGIVWCILEALQRSERLASLPASKQVIQNTVRSEQKTLSAFTHMHSWLFAWH